MNKIGSRETVKYISSIRVRCKLKVVWAVLLSCFVFASYFYCHHISTDDKVHDYIRYKNVGILQKRNSSFEQTPCYTTMEDEMYAYGDVIFEAVGHTELQQYDRLMKNNPNVSYQVGVPHLAPFPTGYIHSVMAVSSTMFVIK